MVFGRSVACPLHNWTIGLCDGQALAPDVGCAPRFQVRVAGRAVYLHAQELASHALHETRPLAGPAVCT
jgi:nitrite reductase (NADH) small subunit